MEKNEDFNFKQQPGMVLKKDLSINDGEAVISIITPYYNCANYIMQTANSVFNQTFPYWEWIIVNDGSTEPNTANVLEQLEKMDKRIKVINQKNQGRLAARDNAVKNASTDLIMVLDSDDMIDETYLECAYWSLKTNPEASWVYTDLVTFDGQNFLWKKIFDCEQEKKENILPVCALIRKEAIEEVGGYSAVDKDVHEDWHMWLRMLEKRRFPIRMNYYGFWYRQKKEGGVYASISKDKQKQKHAENEIKKQAKKINMNISALQFPTSVNYDYNSYPTVFDWNRKPIFEKGKKINLLFIFPWLELGGADKFNLDLIANLDKDKYTVTVLTTEPCDYKWRQKFEEHASIFDLSTFLQRKDWPAFIHYIIKSRNIDITMISNSFFGYYALPWLKSQFPEVIFTDYIHSEVWGWRNGGYPRESTAMSNILDRSYTCTEYLKSVMYSKMQRQNKNVETVYIGVDSNYFDEDKVNIDDYPDITKYKDIYEGKKIILFLARVSVEKRPLFAIEAFKKLCDKHDDVVLFIVGSGDREKQAMDLAKKYNLSDKIIFFGAQSDTRPFYKLASVEIICSLVEGLTLTTYEGMSMKTPVVSANIGGQKELIDEKTGILVDNIQNPKELYLENYVEEEIMRYATALERILYSKDYEKMRENCRNKILNGFTINNMIEKFDRDFTEMVQNGTSVDKSFSLNEDLYRQLIVMYNEIDKRSYFSSEGGIKDFESIMADEMEYQYFKDIMWQNKKWRNLNKALEKMKLKKILKKTRISKIVVKFMKKNVK